MWLTLDIGGRLLESHLCELTRLGAYYHGRGYLHLPPAPLDAAVRAYLDSAGLGYRADGPPAEASRDAARLGVATAVERA